MRCLFKQLLVVNFTLNALGEKKLADSCGKLQCYGLSVCKRLDKYSNVNIPALSNKVKRSKCFLRGHEKSFKRFVFGHQILFSKKHIKKSYLQALSLIFIITLVVELKKNMSDGHVCLKVFSQHHVCLKQSQSNLACHILDCNTRRLQNRLGINQCIIPKNWEMGFVI